MYRATMMAYDGHDLVKTLYLFYHNRQPPKRQQADRATVETYQSAQYQLSLCNGMFILVNVQ